MSSVVIRGYGIVSAYGLGCVPLVAGLRASRAPLTPLTESPVAALNGVNVSALPAGCFAHAGPGALDAVLAAVDEALRAAGVSAPLDDCALVCGGGNTFAQAEQEYLRSQQEAPERRPRVYDAGFLTTQIAHALGVRGPVLTFSTACSSSANALLVARDMILRGQVPRALVVGVESLNTITLGGFQSLMMIDAQGCRPFDSARAGLQLGEGAAAVLLEARGSGARLLGGANLCDIHHVTSASPDGSGMARCMHAALGDAGVGAHDIAAIKAHGTASRENDAAEAAAMRTVFAPALPPFTALKRYLGHTLGACGAIETVALLAALDAGFVPASAGFSRADVELGCAPLTTPLSTQRGNYLLNYFGFGGNYASLVIGYE
jgi:3-oxoacyl-[acyl-carrier-protein] synthase I